MWQISTWTNICYVKSHSTDLQVFLRIIMFEKETFDWNIIYLHKSNPIYDLAYETQCPNLTNNFLFMIPDYKSLDALNVLHPRQKILLYLSKWCTGFIKGWKILHCHVRLFFYNFKVMKVHLSYSVTWCIFCKLVLIVFMISKYKLCNSS